MSLADVIRVLSSFGMEYILISKKKMAEPGDIPPCNTTTQRQTQDSDITQVSTVISKVYIRYGVGGCSLLLYEPFDANWGKVIVLG